MGAMPLVSIILPTFNRADVIGRAIASVRAQTLRDWELLIIDDGSTDGTADSLTGIDDRIRILRQANAGAYVARNFGLREARGQYITFQDSDDEWAPHFLEMTVAFLRSHPNEQFVTTEFWEDWGGGPAVKHDLYEIGEQYPALAKAVGSRLFEPAAGDPDPYLRAYSSREPIGEWGRETLVHAGVTEAFVYHGRLFEHMRFGYLNWLPVVVATRHAIDTIGPFDTNVRSAADYRYLCLLTRSFEAHMIAVPLATKHDRAPGSQALKQDHLAKGPESFRTEVNKLGFFDELFFHPHENDPELILLRCHYCLNVARAALRQGMREEARRYLKQAARPARRLWMAYPGWALTTAIPSGGALRAGFLGMLRTLDVAERLWNRETTPAALLGKVLSHLR